MLARDRARVEKDRPSSWTAAFPGRTRWRRTLAALVAVILGGAARGDAKVGALEFVTFNTWNVNEPFQSRIDHAIEGLRAEAADVIALQEIYLEGPGVPFRADERIATALRMDRISHAAATVPLGDGQATEGLALLSRHPIVASTYLTLPTPNGGNGRIVLQGTISTPVGLVDCYVTHLSTNASERDEQAKALFAFVQSVPHVQPPVILGDLNAVPTSLALLFLTGSIPAGGVRGNLVDGWPLLHPGDGGPTFATANAPGQPLDRRFDYVLLGSGTASEPAGGRWVEMHRILDQADGAGVFPSDHLGMSATLRFDGEAPPAAKSGGGCAVARDASATPAGSVVVLLFCAARVVAHRRRRPTCQRSLLRTNCVM